MPELGAVSLKEHFEARIAALEKATEVASGAMDRRLDGMNEFRDTLRDQASRFVTREELDIKIGVVVEAISELKMYKAQMEGRASVSSVYVSYAIALLGIVLSVISLLK